MTRLRSFVASSSVMTRTFGSPRRRWRDFPPGCRSEPLARVRLPLPDQSKRSNAFGTISGTSQRHHQRRFANRQRIPAKGEQRSGSHSLHVDSHVLAKCQARAITRVLRASRSRQSQPRNPPRNSRAWDCMSSAVRTQVDGCWAISRKVWKYPSRRCSPSLLSSISFVTGWTSERWPNHSACDRNGE